MLHAQHGAMIVHVLFEVKAAQPTAASSKSPSQSRYANLEPRSEHVCSHVFLATHGGLTTAHSLLLKKNAHARTRSRGNNPPEASPAARAR